MANILIFGDSITWGAWDKKGGWVERLKCDTNEKNVANADYDQDIYNLGVSGDSVAELLRRFEFEVRARAGEKETILVFAVGLNDSQILKDNIPRFSLERFRENLGMLSNIGKKISSKIIFVGLTPVDDDKVDPMPWAPEKSYKNESVKKFNFELRLFCEKEKIDFIDVYSELIKKDYKGLLQDGAHPNSKGHKKIYEIVKEFLIEKGVI